MYLRITYPEKLDKYICLSVMFTKQLTDSVEQDQTAPEEKTKSYSLHYLLELPEDVGYIC